MIGLLIQDNAYEQDIRELLMSFYPGETYAHEVKDELEFYVETRLGQGEISVLIWDRDGGRDGMDQGGAAALPAGQGPEEGNPVSWKLSVSRTGASDLSDHSATKNVVKKMFYQMLMERTGTGLPWGSSQESAPPRLPLPGWRRAGMRMLSVPS